jgi:alpha-ribazole phosphatase
MTRFWLLRHGEPAEDSRQRCYGSLDVGLSANGRVQMARVAESLATEQFSAIYTSPRSRAAESAAIVARGCRVEIVPEFREIDFGDFEGLAYDEIAERYPDLYREWMEHPTEVRFPNGESFSAMKSRVLAAFARIRNVHEGQTVAIVSHGGVNRVLIAWALQMPDEGIFRIAQDHAAANLLVFFDETPSVRLLNRTPD